MITKFANKLTAKTCLATRFSLSAISPFSRSLSYSLINKPFNNFSQLQNNEDKVENKENKQESYYSDIKINKFKNVEQNHDKSEKKSKQQEQEDLEQEQEMTPLFKLAIFSLGACGLFIYYKLNQMQSQLKKIDDVRVSHKGQANIGENWELIDTNGDKLTPQNLYGSYYLVYFGFCHCPDICPANLIKIRNALNKIKSTSDGKDQDIKVLFISVDPERDSPEIIRQFLDMYDPSFLGATGLISDETKLKETLKSFKVVANKIFYEPDDEELKVLQEKYKGDESKIYTMDHTTNTFLMGTKGEFINFYDGNRPEEELANQVLQSILTNQKQLKQQQLQQQQQQQQK